MQGFWLTVLIIAAPLMVIVPIIIRYKAQFEPCPNCSEKLKRRSGRQTSLEKEVRYKDVTRRVKDKDGNVIKTYTERVPVNYSHNRYQLKCESCGHEWSIQKWETY